VLPLRREPVAWQATARARLAALALMAALMAACTGTGAPILANPPAPRPSIAPPTAAPSHPADPLPVVLPRDDGPHDRLTEWWYYTGHLAAGGGAADGPGTPQTFGFEFVIFRAERGSFPTTWASHLAITDETGDQFHYAQRLEVGESVDRSPRDADGTPTGFDLSLTGSDPPNPTTLDRPSWEMRGGDGRDHLAAAIDAVEATAQGSPPLAFDLDLTRRKPAALHDRDGWIDFGPGGGSYYYSRTLMAATGRLTLADTTFRVTGEAWFDHQWGDFISVGGGGWDWFAINLDDGTDITLSLVRDADGSYPLVYGTLVDRAGATHHLESTDFVVSTTARWRSPGSGADYPAGWSISIPGERLTIELRPTVADQELDTRATTGVVYWEGSQVVTARRGEQPVGGQAYVELTGYAPSGVGRVGPNP
jgi:predicted secreted hydrolase